MCAVRVFRRTILLAALVAAGLGVMAWSTRPSGTVVDYPRLSFVTTAHQHGVVGYRDPVGALSADGRRVAFSEGRRLYESPVGGGTRTEVAIAEGQIRHVVALGSTSNWIFEDTGADVRWWIASAKEPKRPLYAEGRILQGRADGATVELRPNPLRQIAASQDGQWLGAIVAAASGPELWKVHLDGGGAERLAAGRPMAFPAWMNSTDVACTVTVEGRSRLSAPCGASWVALTPDVDVIGPLAFSRAAQHVAFASPNDAGTVDLWTVDLETRRARRLTAFERDAYAPSAAVDGTTLFKVQSYRTSVVELELATGRATQLSTLQAETPSYHPDGRRIGVTYGTWRRVLDDAKYPDIAQEIGVLRTAVGGWPDDSLLEVVAQSDSEDQAMTWSPNGRWIAFHTHREQSDDIWLRPVDKTQPDRRVSHLGRGAEVGWPRWSPDGRLVLYDGASPATGRSVLYVVGIDQESGGVTSPPREVVVSGFEGEITHGEWLPDSATICGIAKVAPGEHALFTVPVNGGPPTVFHRFSTEHDFPGHAVSPDGQQAAFIAPAADGYYQIFQIPIRGGPPTQITTDPTHKTQPAWSPDGARLAYTVWSYTAQFWTMRE